MSAAVLYVNREDYASSIPFVHRDLSPEQAEFCAISGTPIAAIIKTGIMPFPIASIDSAGMVAGFHRPDV